MPGATFRFQLRPASLADAGIVADLEALRDPDDPRDPVILRHWWVINETNEVSMRRVAVQETGAIAYVSARHDPWQTTDERFGTLNAVLRPNIWTDARFEELVKVAEEWLKGEGVKTAIARVQEKFTDELRVFERIGYREERRMRTSELDLLTRHKQIVTTLGACRLKMQQQGVRLLLLSEDSDPEKLTKLYRMTIEAEKDIPTSAPWRALSFDEWKRLWFDNPGIRADRFWVAREDNEIVGMSSLDFPVTRGIPYTALTCTAREVRGRGIARALKYESMSQAIELGFTRVRTMNDADNAPILHINKEMGYRLVVPVIELHRDLAA